MTPLRKQRLRESISAPLLAVGEALVKLLLKQRTFAILLDVLQGPCPPPKLTGAKKVPRLVVEEG